MKEITLFFKEGLAKGLRSTDLNPRNKQALTFSQGAFPKDNVIHALEDISMYQLDLVELSVSFPYPQVFVLTQETLVCTLDKIYKYADDELELLIGVGITPGSTWTVADYGAYVILTNGNTLVVKNATSGVYSAYTACDIPQCLCLCDVNGQLIIGAPGTTVPSGFSK